jgi:hypothetical protein
MQRVGLMVVSILVLATAATADAQVVVRPGPPGNRAGGPGLPGRLGVDAFVERILAFDTDDDARITRDELNERLQDLVARGDSNRDGALDADEIRQLAAANPGPVPRGILLAPPSNAESFGSVRLTGVRPPPLQGAEGIISDLRLSPAKKEAALALTRPLVGNAHPQTMTDVTVGELLGRIKTLLDSEEFENFKAALDRQRGRPPALRTVIAPGR